MQLNQSNPEPDPDLSLKLAMNMKLAGVKASAIVIHGVAFQFPLRFDYNHHEGQAHTAAMRQRYLNWVKGLTVTRN